MQGNRLISLQAVGSIVQMPPAEPIGASRRQRS